MSHPLDLHKKLLEKERILALTKIVMTDFQVGPQPGANQVCFHPGEIGLE